MKKTNLIIFGSAVLAVFIAVTGIAMKSFAAENDNISTGQLQASGRAEHGPRWLKADNGERGKAEAALEAGDYKAWLEAVPENCPLREKINEGNFSRLVEANNLMKQAGDIMKELGFNGPDKDPKTGTDIGKGWGKGLGKRVINSAEGEKSAGQQ